MLCCAEVNDTGSTGLVSIASPASTSRHAEFCIPIRRSASLRHDLRQEPYAVTLHVRICAGGGQQWPSLPRPFQLMRRCFVSCWSARFSFDGYVPDLLQEKLRRRGTDMPESCMRPLGRYQHAQRIAGLE